MVWQLKRCPAVASSALLLSACVATVVAEDCGQDSSPGPTGAATVCACDEETSLLQSFLSTATRFAASSASDNKVDAAQDAEPLDRERFRQSFAGVSPEQLKTSRSFRRSFVAGLLDHATMAAQQDGKHVSAEVSAQMKDVEQVVRGLLLEEHKQDKKLLQRLYNDVPALLGFVGTREADFNKTFLKYSHAGDDHWACRAAESASCPKFDFCMNELAFAEEEDRPEECETVIGECIQYREHCRKLQTVFEVEACDADVSANHVRDGYANKFGIAAAAYEAAASDVKLEEANRKAEFRSLEELACVCEKAASGSTNAATDVAACKEKQTDTGGFDLTYKDRVPAATMRALPDIPLPCSKAYTDSLRRRMPPYTESQTCSECKRSSLVSSKDNFSTGYKDGYFHAFGTKPDDGAVPAEDTEGSRSHNFDVAHDRRVVAYSEDLRRSVAEHYAKGYARGFGDGLATLRQVDPALGPTQDSNNAPARQKTDSVTLEVAKSFEKGFEKGFMKSVNRQLKLAKDSEQVKNDKEQLGKDKALLKQLQDMGKYPAKIQEQIKHAFWAGFDQSFEKDFEGRMVQSGSATGGADVILEQDAPGIVEGSGISVASEVSEVLA